MNDIEAKTTIIFNRLSFDIITLGDDMMMIFDTLKGFYGYFTLLMSDKVRVTLISSFIVDFHKT